MNKRVLGMQASEELYQDFSICSLIFGHDAENHGKYSIYGILDNFSSYLDSSWEKYLPTPPTFGMCRGFITFVIFVNPILLSSSFTSL